MAERRNALIIATYQYEDTELRQLVSPAHDAEALSRVLEDPVIGGFNVKINGVREFIAGMDLESFQGH